MRGDQKWRNISGLARDAALRFGDAVALIENDHRISFREIEELMDRCARGLHGRGFRAGDRAIIWAPNSWRWIIAALAVHALGGVVAPVNTRFRSKDLAYVLGRVSPRLVVLEQGFLGADYLGMFEEARGAISFAPLVVDIAEQAAAGCVTLADLLNDDQGCLSDAMVNGSAGDAPADIIFTSGTTGSPRGVVTTHAQVLRGFYDFGAQCGLESGDRYAIVNPFSHSFGYRSGWIMALMFGAAVWPLPVLDVAKLLQLVEREKITVLPGPPTLYQTMLSSPELSQRDLSSLRLAWTGAASIPPALITAMRRDLGFERVFTAYALTEATAVATLTKPNDSDEIVAGTSGRALPDIEVRVASGSRELRAGESGEIQIRGYNVMEKYLDDPKATAEAVDAEGWLHTGDIGSLDDQGYLRISGRLKEMIIVGGFNVYPAEVENELLQHPSIAEAAVIGIPDERMGEAPLAVVVARSGAAIDADEIIAWLRTRIANFKAPRSLVVVAALPRNALGKVIRNELKAMVSAGLLH